MSVVEPRKNGGGMPKVVQAKHVPVLERLMLGPQSRRHLYAVSSAPIRVVEAKIRKLINQKLIYVSYCAPEFDLCELSVTSRGINEMLKREARGTQP